MTTKAAPSIRTPEAIASLCCCIYFPKTINPRLKSAAALRRRNRAATLQRIAAHAQAAADHVNRVNCSGGQQFAQRERLHSQRGGGLARGQRDDFALADRAANANDGELYPQCTAASDDDPDPAFLFHRVFTGWRPCENPASAIIRSRARAPACRSSQLINSRFARLSHPCRDGVTTERRNFPDFLTVAIGDRYGLLGWACLPPW